MKCDNCGSAEAEVEFDAKTKDGATVYESRNLCYGCLDQIMTSLMGEKERLECANCGRMILPKSAVAMKDKDGRAFCGVNCACDFYSDTMGLGCIKRDSAETEEDNNDNDT